MTKMTAKIAKKFILTFFLVWIYFEDWIQVTDEIAQTPNLFYTISNVPNLMKTDLKMKNIVMYYIYIILRSRSFIFISPA